MGIAATFDDDDDDADNGKDKAEEAEELDAGVFCRVGAAEASEGDVGSAPTKPLRMSSIAAFTSPWAWARAALAAEAGNPISTSIAEALVSLLQAVVGEPVGETKSTTSSAMKLS